MSRRFFSVRSSKKLYLMDDSQEVDFFVQNSGVWTGQRLDSSGAVLEVLVWNLSLTPNTPYPSAFGATKKEDSSRARVLHGKAFLWPFLNSLQVPVTQQLTQYT